MKQQKPSQSETILVRPKQGMQPSHPLFLAQERNYFLEQKSNQISTQLKLPSMDLRRNMRIDYFMGQYAHLKSEADQQKRIREARLGSEEFTSIFSHNESDNINERRQKKQKQKLRNTLFKNYIQNPTNYQRPQHDYQQGQQDEQPDTILEDWRTSNKRKELYIIDFQIGRLKKQQQIQRIVKNKQESCQNNQLISKLSGHIISGYMVYFDQIFASLIDQILEQEVMYLNNIEAQYHISSEPKPQSQDLHKIYSENSKTLKMMEMVKQLDDLCDQP